MHIKWSNQEDLDEEIDWGKEETGRKTVHRITLNFVHCITQNLRYTADWYCTASTTT